MKDIDSVSKNTTGYMLYFANKRPREIEKTLRIEKFSFPVVVDRLNRLNKLNNFSSSEDFHYFLLDKNNNVKIVGNPISNRKIMKLYFYELEK